MATRRNVPEIREANISFEAMEAAIPKIDRRIAELDQFDVNSVNDRSDPRISALESKLDALLVDMFGTGTVEYNRYCNYTRVDTAGLRVGGVPIHEVRDGLRRGIGYAKAQLEAIKSGFLEALEDAGRTAASKTLKAYQGLELHPAIERAAGSFSKTGIIQMPSRIP